MPLCRKRAAAAVLLAILFRSWFARAGVVVVYSASGDGLPVYYGHAAAPAERRAAQELGDVLGRMAGRPWVVAEEGGAAVQGIYVGTTSACGAREKPQRDLLRRKAGEVGPDAFRVTASEGRIVIDGATPEACRTAVCWFLQNFGGVRWYSPGPLGEEIPLRREWSVPEMNRVVEPFYVSREILGMKGVEAVDWAVRNGLAQRIEYSHALSRVFSPSLFRAHPDWRAFVDGRMDEPGGADDGNWQPELTKTEAAEYAAEAAVKAFWENPDRPSISLGINDTVRFDQSAATREVVEPLRFFRGKPDYSPLVFAFMNRAAAVVAERAPGHYLGCLAYFWCENSPPFPVNPIVIPYVCADRSQYFDANYRAEDLALLSRWNGSGVAAYGLWEYAEGEFFLVPRVPYHALFDAVREGARRGARGYVAEVEPQRGFDEFKVWALARLLWNPELPYEELADDFFPGYYGPAAGPMRRFFEGCERQWMQQTGQPYWLKYYRQEDQALLFPPETCHRLRLELEEAMRRAGDDAKIGARISRTRRAFAVTEALAEFDLARRAILAGVPAGVLSKETGAGLLAGYLGARERLEKAYAEACEGPEPAMEDGQLVFFLRHDPVPGLLWRFGREAGEVFGRSGAKEAVWRTLAESLSDGRLEKAPNRLTNASLAKRRARSAAPLFLHPKSGPYPESWAVREMPTETNRVGVLDTPEGDAVVRVEGAWDTQVGQWAAVVPGSLCVAMARLRGEASPGDDAGLFLSFLSAGGKPVGETCMALLPKGGTASWRSAVVAGKAPDEAAWVGVAVAASRQVAGDWLEASSLELREVEP